MFDYKGAADFFMKEELIEFVDNVCEKLNEKYAYRYNFEIYDILFTSNNTLQIEVLDSIAYISAMISLVIDMRRIRRPLDINKYVDIAVTKFIAELDPLTDEVIY